MFSALCFLVAFVVGLLEALGSWKGYLTVEDPVALTVGLIALGLAWGPVVTIVQTRRAP